MKAKEKITKAKIIKPLPLSIFLRRNCGKGLQVLLSLSSLRFLIVRIAQGTWHFWKFLKWSGMAPRLLQNLGGGTCEFWETRRKELENSQNLADIRQTSLKKGRRRDLTSLQTRRSNVGSLREEKGRRLLRSLCRKRETQALITLGRQAWVEPLLCEEKNILTFVRGIGRVPALSLVAWHGERRRPCYLRAVDCPLHKHKTVIPHPLICTSSHVKLFDSFAPCSRGRLERIFFFRAPSHTHPSPYDEYGQSCGAPQADGLMPSLCMNQ